MCRSHDVRSHQPQHGGPHGVGHFQPGSNRQQRRAAAGHNGRSRASPPKRHMQIKEAHVPLSSSRSDVTRQHALEFSFMGLALPVPVSTRNYPARGGRRIWPQQRSSFHFMCSKRSDVSHPPIEAPRLFVPANRLRQQMFRGA